MGRSHRRTSPDFNSGLFLYAADSQFPGALLNRLHVSGVYPPRAGWIHEVKHDGAIIDGEVIVQDERGVSDFEGLKSAIRWLPQSLIFCAFDLLHLNGKDLRQRQLLERRARLEELIPSEHPLLFSEEFSRDASAFFRACANHQLEGIVSKLGSSKYRSGRSNLRRNASLRALCSSSARRVVRQKLRWHCWLNGMRRG
jgi:ATP dependent DNA ligase domain